MWSTGCEKQREWEFGTRTGAVSFYTLSFGQVNLFIAQGGKVSIQERKCDIIVLDRSVLQMLRWPRCSSGSEEDSKFQEIQSAFLRHPSFSAIKCWFDRLCPGLFKSRKTQWQKSASYGIFKCVHVCMKKRIHKAIVAFFPSILFFEFPHLQLFFT